MSLFGRIASVVVGLPGEQGTKIEGLRITSDISTSNTSNPNKAEIEIYNLSETTRAKFNKPNLKVWLYAGYEEDTGLQLIYSGDIVQFNNGYTPPDVISKITCGDGAILLRDSLVSLSYAAGAKASTMVSDLSKKLNLPVKENYDKEGITFNNGFSFSGRTKDALDKATASSGLQWSIQNGAVQVIKKGSHNNEQVVLLSPDSGLIGLPEKLDNAGFGTEDSKPVNGRKLVSLLQPKFIPGGRVEVKSNLLNGTFIIQSVEHKGDTRGQDWNTTLEVLPA